MKYIVKQDATLIDYLLQFEKRTNIKRYFKYRLIQVNNQTVDHINMDIKIGDTIEIKQRLSHNLDIIYEDDDIIVINKPSGLLSISTDREKVKTAYHYVSEYVKSKQKNAKIFVVHRLDRDTSGVVMFAKNKAIKQKLQDNWNQIVKKRGYLAIVEGKIKPAKGTIQTHLKENKAQMVYVSSNGKIAITHYSTIQTYKNHSLVEIFLDTGRKNQIRVHMQYLHHPIMGDKKYGAKINQIGRLALHSHVLSFIDPRTKKLLTFEAQIPKEFNQF